jgi:VanZ family protein
VPLARFAGLAWAWLPVIVWMALILSLSGQSDLPARTNPQTGETIRSTFAAAKLAHVVEYALLGLLLLRALTVRSGGVRLTRWLAVALAIVGAGLFGCLDEVRQSFVPRREPSPTDVMLDTASAAAAVLMAAWWRRWRSARQKPEATPPRSDDANDAPAGAVRRNPPAPAPSTPSPSGRGLG